MASYLTHIPMYLLPQFRSFSLLSAAEHPRNCSSPQAVVVLPFCNSDFSSLFTKRFPLVPHLQLHCPSSCPELRQTPNTKLTADSSAVSKPVPLSYDSCESFTSPCQLCEVTEANTVLWFPYFPRACCCRLLSCLACVQLSGCENCLESNVRALRGLMNCRFNLR